MKVLVWLGKTDTKHHDGTFLHQYECFCGKSFLAIPRYVRFMKTVSCGCHRKSGGKKYALGKTPANALLDPEESSFNALYSSYKCSARNKNLPFDLLKEDFKTLTKRNCHFCGDTPSREYKHKWSSANYVYNGLDRKDNKLGYSIDNCLPCCSYCSLFKI